MTKNISNLSVISEAALASIAASANPFGTVPENVLAVEITLRGGGMTMRLDGVAATAQANGIDYPAGSHVLYLAARDMARAQAIQFGGTTTGWVRFLG